MEEKKPEETLSDEQIIKRWSQEDSASEKRISSFERKRGHFDIIGWLLRQNDYMKYAEKNKLAVKLKAGEIYEVDFGINVNAEFSYRHYALVLADSLENNPLVLVCPLKSNFRGAHPASDINLGLIENLDSDHESLAVINQIRTIDKLRIFRKPVINRQTPKKMFLNDSEYGLDEYSYGRPYEPYRLEPKKFQKVISAALTFIQHGFIE